MLTSKTQSKFIEAGDIGAAVGFKDIRTGDTLCAEKHPIVLESMKFPRPSYWNWQLSQKLKKMLDKLGMALGKLAEEDPTFKVSIRTKILSDCYLVEWETSFRNYRRSFKT
jgi:translation elongation factor EF-G